MLLTEADISLSSERAEGQGMWRHGFEGENFIDNKRKMRKDNIFKDDYNLHFNNVILNYMKKNTNNIETQYYNKPMF